jgi:hypothetical protein
VDDEDAAAPKKNMITRLLSIHPRIWILVWAVGVKVLSIQITEDEDENTIIPMSASDYVLPPMTFWCSIGLSIVAAIALASKCETNTTRALTLAGIAWGTSILLSLSMWGAESHEVLLGCSPLPRPQRS